MDVVDNASLKQSAIEQTLLGNLFIRLYFKQKILNMTRLPKHLPKVILNLVRGHHSIGFVNVQIMIMLMIILKLVEYAFLRYFMHADKKEELTNQQVVNKMILQNVRHFV